MKLLSRVCMILVAAATLNPALASPKEFDLGPFGVLVLEIPDGWTTETRSEATGGRTIHVTPPEAIELKCLLTPIPVSEKTNAVDAAKRTAEDVKKRLSEIAEESPLAISTLTGPSAQAFFVSITDKTVTKPTKTDFRYADQGAAALGPMIATFTILTNQKDGAARASAREVIRTARLDPPRPPPQSPTGTVHLNAPGPKWRLALDLPGYELEPIRLRETPPGVKLAGNNPTTGMIVSAFIETSKPGWSAIDHREEAWRIMQKASPMTREKVEKYERGDVALLSYFVPEYLGKPTQQRHVNAYLVRDGMWIDIHLSKPFYALSDSKLFEQVLDSVRIEVEQPAQPR